MKIGDKVRVTRLDIEDRTDTNLKVGDTGTIVASEISILYSVMFGEEIICSNDHDNLEDDGSYIMNRNQLEVITE